MAKKVLALCNKFHVSDDIFSVGIGKIMIARQSQMQNDQLTTASIENDLERPL